jgi:hypothetical protein
VKSGSKVRSRKVALAGVSTPAPNGVVPHPYGVAAQNPPSVLSLRWFVRAPGLVGGPLVRSRPSCPARRRRERDLSAAWHVERHGLALAIRTMRPVSLSKLYRSRRGSSGVDDGRAGNCSVAACRSGRGGNRMPGEVTPFTNTERLYGRTGA